MFKISAFLKTIVTFLFIVSAALQAGAVTDVPTTQNITGSQIAVNQDLTVTELVFGSPADRARINTSHPQLFKDVITLSVNERDPGFISAAFQVSVTFDISFTRPDFTTGSINGITLTVNYDPASGATFVPIDYYHFEGAYEFTAHITSASSSIPGSVKLESSVTATRDYKFNRNQNNEFEMESVEHLTHSLQTGSQELELIWDQMDHPGRTHYDVEWTWVHQEFDAMYQREGDFKTDLIFTHNATRHTVSVDNVSSGTPGTEHYFVPLLYDGTGKLFYRVRPVQEQEDGQWIYGDWSCKGNETTTDYFDWTGHEPTLNWQASTSFAEDGVRKSVVQYADGSMRNRQTVTKDNETQTTIVAETKYDYQGRPAIQVLPAPTLSNVLQFTSNFNRFVSNVPNTNEKDIYDVTTGSVCDVNPAELDNTYSAPDGITGAAQYYSPNNPEKTNGFNQFIPDSKKYPYTQTLYEQNAGGRVLAQSGVGPDHVLNGAHDTRYYYSKPSQQILTALFGPEAGDASHYFKTTVRDANGQYSVSYSDMYGHTVATALAGRNIAGNYTDALSSYVDISNADQISEDMLSNANNHISNNAIISSSSLSVTTDQLYSFNYSLTPPQVSVACPENQNSNLCYDCAYNLEIRITNECGGSAGGPWNFENVHLTDPPGTDCDGSSPDVLSSFSVFLTEGNYTVTKTLTLNSAIQNYYLNEVYLPNNTCQTFESIYHQVLSQFQQDVVCTMTCASCAAALGAYEDYKTAYLQSMGLTTATAELEHTIQMSYNENKAICDALCETDGPNRLDVIEQLMLHDVSPQNGQFALADPDQNFSYPQKSIYRVEGGVFPYQTPLNPDGTPGQYLNDSGEPDPHAAFFLSPVDFANKFNSTWAKSLLYYHPEYKKYQKAKQYLWDAFEWERHHLMHAETYADALADPDLGISTNDIVENDPFYRDVASVSVKNAMIAKINSHFKKVAESPDVYLGMWQMAWAVVNCAQHPDQDGHMDINCMLSAPTVLPLQAGQCPGDINKVWEMFRGWYITERMLDIDNYLNDGLTDVQTYYNSILIPNHYHRVFVRPGSVNGTGNQYEDLFNSASVGPDYGSGGVQDALQQHYTETCESYKLKWISDLTTCPAIADAVAQMTTTEQEDFFAQITDVLKDICIAGSDPTHPLGSSSAAPDANAPYPDFPAALTAFFAEKNIPVSNLCHPYMITYPPTYDTHGSYGAYQAVFTQQNCACDKLEEFKMEKIDKQFGGTLSQFLEAYHHINVSQATLDMLWNGCSGLDDCETFDPSLELPGIFNCGVTNENCIDCSDYAILLGQFHSAFPDLNDAPYQDPDHVEEQQANQVFQLFMNYKTGFNKNWTDYMRFGIACNSAQTKYSCPDLEGYEHAFRINHGQTVGETCQADYLQFFNEQTGNLYSWPDLEAVYLTACGRLPDICTPEISCSQFKAETISFFEWYHGLEDDPLPNCEASFVSYMNAQFGANFSSFSQYSDWYQVHCGETLDICEAYPCSIIRHVIDLYKATDQWMYSDCIDRFVSFFNAYFGSELIWDDIQPLLENCGDRFNICGAQIDCALVQDYITQFDPKSEPCTSILPEGSPERCAECLTQYLNSHFNVAYNYAQWQAIASTCGNSPMTCNPDLDCFKLTDFVTNFIQRHEGENNTDAQCQAFFVSEFNSQYNLSYNLNQVLELYEVMCGAQPAICGFAPPLGPAQLNHFVDQFLKDFPNWQSGTDSCTSLFGKYFKSFTGLELSYDSIVRLYIRITGKAPEICTPKSCEDIQSFYNGYLADYPGSQLPLDMRKLILLKRWESFAGKAVNWSELKAILNSCLVYPDTSQYPPPYLSCDHVLGVTKAFYELRPHQNGPNCTDNFMTFFNSYYGTSLTYQQLVDWAQNNCYLDFSVCGNGGESEEEYPLVMEAYAPVPEVAPLMLCDSGDPVGEPEDHDPCDDVTGMANNAAVEIFNHYVAEINNNFNNSYRSVCLGVAGLEHFTVSYNNPEFHYTLYYYDQAGNLVKTIPPSGVSADFSSTYYNAVKAYRANPNLSRPPSPGHSLATSYRYNSLNAVVEQYSPDGGLTKFYYDKLGRLTFSRNAKQSVAGAYSYTIYDGLGRIEEVGETEISGGITQTEVQTAEDPSTLVPPGRTEITHTGYDAAYISESQFDPLFHPEHLRGRVSYSWVKDMSSDAHYRAATFYSYDAHGNVKTLFHDYHEGVMDDAGNAFKRMDYEYDLISGKVREVAYQPGQPDQFYHRYSYDGENRLKTVETSRDGILWQRDARYGYYKHGPLSRLELGDLGVQGLDYAYTLQGWLKGINSSSLQAGEYDMGEDGKTGSANSLVARDAYGMSLNYFEGDYEPISSNVTPFAVVGSLTGSGNDLFNGNIGSSVVNIPKLGEAKIYGYRYDQLNRLAAMDAYEGLNNVTNAFTPVSLNDYKERFSYSPDGSILTLQRNGQGSNVIDNATWNYYPGTHRLEHIDDVAGRHGFDAGVQGADNYTYSPVGEMTSDVERGLTGISWTVYGKLEEQQLSDGRRINYTYDGGGNRISKQVSGSANANDDYTEWYVRDAGGNILSIYRKSDVLRQTALYKYGVSLLGIKHHTVNMEEAPAGDGITPFIAGEDEYYVNDQRGNNMVTVSDTRTQHDDNSDGIVDYYTANIVTAQDYSSYGSLLEGRQYGNVPRHTYNGKELDKETGWQDYGMRPYLVDVPVFGKVDPIAKSYPELTPYQFAENSPILFIDLDGLEKALPWYLRENKNGGKPVLTLGLGNLPTATKAPHEIAKYNPGPGGSASGHAGIFIYNALVSAWNGIAGTWNDGMDGKTGTDMLRETVQTLEKVKPSDFKKVSTWEDLAGAAITIYVSKKLFSFEFSPTATETISGRWVAENTKGWSARAIEYQEHVTGVKAGTALEVNGVKFDGIRGNTLLEAKSSYDNFVSKKTGQFQDWFTKSKTGANSLLTQARNQIKAANGADIEWNFSTQKTLDATKSYFESQGLNSGITYKLNPKP